MTVSTSEESERRLAEAMRAHASGVGRPGFVSRNPAPLAGQPPVQPPFVGGGDPVDGPGTGVTRGRSAVWTALAEARLTLLLALLAGAVLGVALALLSLLAPGVLPPLG